MNAQVKAVFDQLIRDLIGRYGKKTISEKFIADLTAILVVGLTELQSVKGNYIGKFKDKNIKFDMDGMIITDPSGAKVGSCLWLCFHFKYRMPDTESVLQRIKEDLNNNPDISVFR